MFETLSALEFIIAAMTVYRLSALLAIDDGPYGMFDRWRKWLGKRAAQAQQEDRWTMGRNLAELFHCPYCLGIWTAAPIAYVLNPIDIIEFVSLWIGLAGTQSLLQGLMQYDD